MKFLEQLKVKSKDDIFPNVKEDKILPFFRVYKKIVEHNIINPWIYLFIIIIEYLQLFYELTNDGDEYIQNSSKELKDTTSFYFYQILQYINFSHFISTSYLSYNQFEKLYISTVCIIVINFCALIILDLVNKKYLTRKSQLRVIHMILGVFNYTNVKILVIPFNYVLFMSYSIEEFKQNENVAIDSQSSDALINPLTLHYGGVVQPSVRRVYLILVKCLSSIVIVINLYTLINTSLLFNDLDPIESKLCWAQSYPEIEMYNINLKFFLVLFNVLKGRFYFVKSIFVLVINLQRCTYRFLEWYYSWSTNRELLIILDFGFLFFNFISLILGSYQKQLDTLIGFVVISGIFGTIFYFIIDSKQRSIIGKDISKFTDERQYCELIIELIKIIKQLPKEEKSINDSLFFGYLIQHQKLCHKKSCTTEIVSTLIKGNRAIFANEIESFEITKSDFNLYCKSNKKENYEILTDVAKIHCEKAVYALIKCIIDIGMAKLAKDQIRFLPILEAYVYIHIFDNKFYALFQIMKYYKSNVHYREKFFFFMSLSNVLDKMVEENNLKYTSTLSILSVTDFYYYQELFITKMYSVLQNGRSLFIKLISMRPSPDEVLSESIMLGDSLRHLHSTFNHIMNLNPYEINILRIYAFMIEKIFFMKKLANQNINRLKQNIKFFLMNDKFRNNSDVGKTFENSTKVMMKNFQENSDSAILIVSGILEDLGEILYCNNLIRGILGYEKNELVGFSLNNIIPRPVSGFHNQIILDFYRNGHRRTLDKVKNLFALHKNGTLVNIDLYVCFLPNMDFGLMFIGIFKNSYIINLTVDFPIHHCFSTLKEKPGTIVETREDVENDNELQDIKRSTLLVYHRDEKKDAAVGISHSRDTEELAELINKKTKKTLLFKVEDTGVILLNTKYEILHMNTFASSNIFELSKPLPIQKVHIKKFFKDFVTKLPELESGEAIIVNIDNNGVNTIANQILAETENNSIINTTLNNDETVISQLSLGKSKRFPRSSIIDTRMPMTMTKRVKVSMIKNLTSFTIGEEYYILTLQNRRQNEVSMCETESLNSDEGGGQDETSELNQTSQTFSRIEEKDCDFTLLNNRLYCLEKEKKKLLADMYIPGFAQVARITIYILFLIIFIWVVVSYIIELSELQAIENDLRLVTRSEFLSSDISYFVLSSLLYIRAKIFPFTNNLSLLPMLQESMTTDKQNIYNILKILSEDLSTSGATKMRENITDNSFNFTSITEEGLILNESLNLNLGLTKFIYSMDFLLREKEKYSMSVQEFFNYRYYNPIKVKLYFIFQNYAENIHDMIEKYKNNLSQDITMNILNMRNILLVIFSLSLVFCIVVSIIIMITLYNQETSKQDYLTLLGGLPDLYYERIIRIISIFIHNLDLFMKEDKNINKIKGLLEKDEVFRDSVTRADSFLQKPGERKDECPDESKVVRVINRKNTIISKGDEENDFLCRLDLNQSPKLVLSRRKLRKSSKIINNFFKHQKEKNLQQINSNDISDFDCEEDESQKVEKTYTEYTIAWKKNLLNFLMSSILITSYFMVSILHLYSYFDKVNRIVEVSSLINHRGKSLNSLIIATNLLFLFNSTRLFSSGKTIDMITKVEDVSDTENAYMKLLSELDTESDIYSTIVAYEERDPCESFSGFNTYYNLISCAAYLSKNGLTFQIMQDTNYLKAMYISYSYTASLEVSVKFLEEMFNDPKLIDMMICMNFFGRQFLTDISLTYANDNKAFIQESVNVIHIKFIIYIILLLVLILMYQIILIPQITDLINNLKRVGLFFEDDKQKDSEHKPLI